MSFQLRTPGHSRSSYRASGRRVMTCLAGAKELFSRPLASKWPLFASTRSQLHFSISMTKTVLAQLGSDIETGFAMER